MSKTFASLPRRHGQNECASELLNKVYLSSFESRQFIAGSLESPVSIACILCEYSLKHSSTESNPDMLPKIPYQGVQLCAGIISISSSISFIISTNSMQENPKIGLPS